MASASGYLSQSKTSMYDTVSSIGTWNKLTLGSFSGTLLEGGISLSGPSLSLGDLKGSVFSSEHGVISGHWLMGFTGELSTSAAPVSANAGLKDWSVAAKVGGSVASARVTGGVNYLGANMGLYAEARLGGELGFSVGKRTELHALIISLGLTVSAAKGNDPNAGWAELGSNVWKHVVVPVIPVPSYNTFGPPPGYVSIWGALELSKH